jgi:lipopolysaccharide transport system permease protein
MQILFYVTPVIFPAEMLDARGFSFVYQANPFYHLINIVRAPLLHQSFANSYSYTFVAGYLASLLGVAYIVMRRCDAKVVFWL